MNLPSVAPTAIRFRQPKKNIPQTKPQRDSILQTIRDYQELHQFIPPLPLAELQKHTDLLLQQNHWDPIHRDYVGVLLANETWRDTLATVPYEKRLLLMPKCLRVESKCPAPFDEFGLLCKQCGLCSIQDFQNEAERLGYAVLVAEGSAIVMSLIQTGQIEAIVGISCLSVLERTFPYIEAAAIPAIAVPLLQDDCIDTTVDIDWVWDYIHLTAADTTHRLNLNTLHDEVKTWHNPTHLQNLQASPLPTTQQQANQWLLQDGKRWRPFLLTATYQALRPHTHHTPIPPHIQQAALAIEFFHKASLAHDDIEDHDTLRNGHPTLNHTHGLEIALNLGDCMIGEGYRLLATLPISPSQAQPILRIAAESQLELSHGQGAELLWQRQKTILTPSQTATIFRQKTSPAFRAAILIGAALTDTLPQFEAALSIYSDHLGIAYQIHDDLQDWKNDLQPQKLWTNSIVLAHLLEKATATQQQRWLEGKLSITELSTQQIQQALEKSQLLMESHKQAAIQALQDLENPNLKGLLRRIIGKIFNELEIKGWCNEIQHEKINETRRQEAAHEAAHLQPNLS